MVNLKTHYIAVRHVRTAKKQFVQFCQHLCVVKKIWIRIHYHFVGLQIPQMTTAQRESLPHFPHLPQPSSIRFHSSSSPALADVL